MPGIIEISEGVVFTSTGERTRPKKAEKRPAPATGFRSIVEWERARVPVEWVSARDAPDGLARFDRETSVGDVETDAQADVMTCNVRWMHRLEELGATPIHVVGYRRGDRQIRSTRFPRAGCGGPFRRQRNQAGIVLQKSGKLRRSVSSAHRRTFRSRSGRPRSPSSKPNS